MDRRHFRTAPGAAPMPAPVFRERREMLMEAGPRFAGPAPLRVESNSPHPFDAMARGAAHLKKLIAAAYGGG